MRDLALKVDGIQTLEPRVAALENTAQAHAARLDHMNKVVMAIQVDVQKLSKQFAAGNAEQRAELAVLRSMMQQTLDLLQPKVSL